MSALTVQRVMQEAGGQGQRLDRLNHAVYNVVMDKLEGVGLRFPRSDEIMNKVLMETDRRSQDMRTSIGQFVNEQTDIRKVVEELARRVDVMQNGTHPGGVSSDSNTTGEQNLSDASVALQLEIEDLTRKVARLSDQSTQHTQQINGLTPLAERVDLAESQIIRWRYRLPDLTDNDDDQPVVTAVEVQEQLNAFKETTRRKIQGIIQQTVSLDEKIGILERARSETWELVSHRLNSTLDRTATSLSEQMAELDNMMQSQGTTAATSSDQPQTSPEDFAMLEPRVEARYQAFTQEVDQMREEWD